MTDRARAYLLERCLRLEAQIARLEGRATDLPSRARRICHKVTPDEIEAIRTLRRRGMTHEQIAGCVSRSVWTARYYTKDVLIEREACYND